MDAAYLVSLGGGVATIVGTVTAVGVVVTKRLTAIHDQNSEQLRKQAEFNSDWYGNAARPGVDAQPGMMERVKSIEKELRPNGGSSLRDAVNRVETRQIEVERRITDIERRHDPPRGVADGLPDDHGRRLGEELWAAFDNSPSTVPWTELLTDLPWWITMPAALTLSVWLPLHLWSWYRKRHRA